MTNSLARQLFTLTIRTKNKEHIESYTLVCLFVRRVSKSTSLKTSKRVLVYVGVSLILLPVQAVDIIGVENVHSLESTSARIVFAAQRAVANVQSPRSSVIFASNYVMILTSWELVIVCGVRTFVPTALFDLSPLAGRRVAMHYPAVLDTCLSKEHIES